MEKYENLQIKAIKELTIIIRQNQEIEEEFKVLDNFWEEKKIGSKEVSFYFSDFKKGRKED